MDNTRLKEIVKENVKNKCKNFIWSVNIVTIIVLVLYIGLYETKIKNEKYDGKENVSVNDSAVEKKSAIKDKKRESTATSDEKDDDATKDESKMASKKSHTKREDTVEEDDVSNNINKEEKNETISDYDYTELDEDEQYSSNAQLEEYILPYADSMIYDKEILNTLSDVELRFARNEIIARHGRTFASKELQEYFESCSWYDGRYSPEEFDGQMDNILNSYEKANIETIKEIENERNI